LIIRLFTCCILFILVLPFAAQAQEIILGTVKQEMGTDGIVFVIEIPDRPRVMPEELVKIQTRIPGIDEVIESAKGYVHATRDGNFQVKITEGEPAPGETVVLLQGKFLNGNAPKDEETWRRMAYEDLRKGINKPANVGAACVLAAKFFNGDEIEKNDYSAYVLYSLASQYEPSADCAAEYGLRLLSGDLNNDPPKWSVNPEEGMYWLKYAAEGGSYMGMIGYASFLSVLGKRRESEKWFKKAIEIEPEQFKGSAQKQREAVRKR